MTILIPINYINPLSLFRVHYSIDQQKVTLLQRSRQEIEVY